MQSFSSKYFVQRALLATLLLVSTFSPTLALYQGAAAPATAKTATLTKAEKKASDEIKLETIRRLTTELSSPQFEGRGTGQPGADKAANYLADYFTKLGLKPAGENGTYLQQIKFRSAEVLPESTIKVGDTALNHAEDYVVLPPYTSEKVDVAGDIVFIGYGVVSPELKRDDLAGLDLKGKIVVLMGGQPTGVDAAAWQKATNPQARAMSIFGKGALAMVVAGAGTQAQPFSLIASYLSRRRVSLASSPAPTFKVPPVVLVSDGAMEKIFAGTGSTYAQVLDKAKTGEMVSRDLGKAATLAVRFKLAETTSSNVAALFEGSDPKLKEEAIVYTAHYDAYGTENGKIFPGAADNALGTATIAAIAEAFAKAYAKPASRPRRSIIFLAVTGEEYGLFGAEHWVKNPTWPLEKVAADINFDGIGTEVYGPVKRVVGFGAEHSDLGKIFEDVTVATGNIVTPDPMPEENAFVRSDHYAFVKQGVPALMLLGGPAGDVSVWIPRARKWLDTDYHSPSDTVKPDWDWTGPQTLAKVGMIIGLRAANADAMPAWLPTSRFNKPRTATKPAATNPAVGQ